MSESFYKLSEIFNKFFKTQVFPDTDVLDEEYKERDKPSKLNYRKYA